MIDYERLRRTIRVTLRVLGATACVCAAAVVTVECFFALGKWFANSDTLWGIDTLSHCAAIAVVAIPWLIVFIVLVYMGEGE